MRERSARWTVDRARGAFAVVLLAALPGIASASDLIGQASVMDGDTIEIHGQRIRLWRIDAPESAQLCRGSNSLQYRCGSVAANSLSTFIAGKPVTCTAKDVDRYGRTVALCTVAGVDLARWLVGCYSACNIDPLSRGIGVQNLNAD